MLLCSRCGGAYPAFRERKRLRDSAIEPLSKQLSGRQRVRRTVVRSKGLGARFCCVLLGDL